VTEVFDHKDDPPNPEDRIAELRREARELMDALFSAPSEGGRSTATSGVGYSGGTRTRPAPPSSAPDFPSLSAQSGSSQQGDGSNWAMVDDDETHAQAAETNSFQSSFPGLPPAGPKPPKPAMSWKPKLAAPSATAQAAMSAKPSAVAKPALSERESRLAAAFGVSKERAALEFSQVGGMWTPEVLEVAATLKAFVFNMEKDIMAFMQDRDKGRLCLPSMNHNKRVIVHELAANHGLESQAFDAEPHRHIELFKEKFGRLTVPTPTLTQALKDPRGAMRANLESMRGKNALIFTDVVRGVNLRTILAHCESEYRVAWVKEDEAVVAFLTQKDFDITRDTVGGGDREKFRVTVATEAYFDKLSGKGNLEAGVSASDRRGAAPKIEVDDDGFATVASLQERSKLKKQVREEEEARLDEVLENPWGALGVESPLTTPLASPIHSPMLPPHMRAGSLPGSPMGSPLLAPAMPDAGDDLEDGIDAYKPSVSELDQWDDEDSPLINEGV